GGGGLDADLRPVGLELFREQHRQRRGHALAHLGAIHHYEHAFVGADAEPRVWGKGSRGEGARAVAAACGEMEADDEAGAGDARGLKELTAIDLRGAHVT